MLEPDEQRLVDALRSAGHVLRLDPFEEVDMHALDKDEKHHGRGHHGPGCKVCGRRWCLPCFEHHAPRLGVVEPCEGRKT